MGGGAGGPSGVEQGGGAPPEDGAMQGGGAGGPTPLPSSPPVLQLLLEAASAGRRGAGLQKKAGADKGGRTLSRRRARLHVQARGMGGQDKSGSHHFLERRFCADTIRSSSSARRGGGGQRRVAARSRRRQDGNFRGRCPGMEPLGTPRHAWCCRALGRGRRLACKGPEA